RRPRRTCRRSNRAPPAIRSAPRTTVPPRRSPTPSARPPPGRSSEILGSLAPLGPLMTPPLSILDLAIVGEHQTVRESLDATVVLARHAEELGFTRIWYAEHHNMASIASA